MAMKKLSILALLVVALAVVGCNREDNSSDKHSSNHGGCCCCGGGSGTSGSVSTLNFRGFGQPTTYINTVGVTGSPTLPISITITPGNNPDGSNMSLPQPILFNTALLNAHADVYEGSTKIYSIPPGGSYIIASFYGDAKTFSVRAYKNVSTEFENASSVYNPSQPADADVYYSGLNPAQNAVIGIH